MYAVGEKSCIKRQLHLVPENITILGYDLKKSQKDSISPRLQHFANHVDRAAAIEKLLIRQRAKGLNPDVILAHPGWGEVLYLQEIFPHAKLICYFEFFFSTLKNNINFDPEFPSTYQKQVSFRMSNTACLLALDSCDVGVSPTYWQRSSQPQAFHTKIKVIHDGIDTTTVKPTKASQINFKQSSQGDITLSNNDEIISYSVRNLEPSRGFHRFMRALTKLQKIRPQAWFVIVGGDEQSYSSRPESGTWKEAMLSEVKDQLDMSRILFTGKIPYPTLLDLFSLTSLHVYWTTSFVLSWSLMEAMGCKAPILASSTPPVKEVIDDGENGILFDFFDEQALIDKFTHLLASKTLRTAIGNTARETIKTEYDYATVCLPQHIKLIEGV